MRSSPQRAVSRLQITIVTALIVLATPLAPVAAFAQSELYPGAVALVANTGGEPVLLRETPSFEAAVLSSFWEGAPADVLDGPVYSEDGTAWHGVAIGGLTGYIVAGYLVGSGQGEAASVELMQEAVPAEAAPMEAAPVETAPVETMATGEFPAPAASLSEAPVNPIATADLNLRAGPSFADAVLLVIPAGSPLTTTGEWSQGFAGVTFNGQYGWVDSGWLGAGEAAPVSKEALLLQESVPVETAAAVESVPADAAGVIGDLTAPAGETVYTADVVNLRAGPAETDAVLRVLPPGGALTVTGEAIGSWLPVWYNGTWGFVSDDLLTWDAAAAAPAVTLAQEAAPEGIAPESAAAADPDGAALQATTLSDVNLRAAPDMTAAVLNAIPPGTTMETLAGPEQGFYHVQYFDQTGWVSGEYLEVSANLYQRGKRDNRQEGKIEGSAAADNANANADLGAGGIIWPVSGGLWYVMQGYNGSSHQNQDGLHQYQYSLDLARRDGNTAGQPVRSPVNGVVTWTDPSTGGISIDIGNGHAVAMFHVSFMGGLQAGTAVQQGQHLGEISGPGGPGFAGTPHLHFTLWSSGDNGNWDRQAVPFSGPYAISGMDFPNSGGGNAHRGTEFSP